jgi:uncharacterized protein (DUF2235 family)
MGILLEPNARAETGRKSAAWSDRSMAALDSFVTQPLVDFAYFQDDRVLSVHSHQGERMEQKKKFKHIILLIDGTWNSAARGTFRDTTNIFRLNHALDTADKDGNPQVTFYIPGPGTRGWTDKPLGGLFGAGIDEIIKEAYVNIASNYDDPDDEHDSDRIYLFGFSRGAVAARALSGLISKCGLLYGRSIDHFWRVWAHFLAPHKDPSFQNDIADYTNDDVHIEMLGTFDTVLGRRHNKDNVVSKLRFSDFKLDALVRHGVQILAMDDNRRRFLPIMWDGVSDSNASSWDEDRIQQIWLPGVHADIGGICSNGNQETNFLSNVSFLTMVEQIRKHTSLTIDQDYVDEVLDSLRHVNSIHISNERAGPYMKTLGYRNRKTFRERFGQEHAVGEMLHPIFESLHGRKIYVRGKYTIYSNSHFDNHSEGLPMYPTELRDFYADQCHRAISAMVK